VKVRSIRLLGLVLILFCLTVNKMSLFRSSLAPLGYVKVRSNRLLGLVLILFCLTVNKMSLFRSSLAPLGYVKVRSIRLLGLVLILFCLDRHVPYLRWRVPSLLFSRVVDPDPDWIRIQSGQWIRIRNPDSESGSGSRREKMTHKIRKKLRNFMF
jgi:hypothetical protein